MASYPINRRAISKGRQSGFSIIEILVAMSLLGIVIASSSNLIIVSMHANKASSTYAAVIADVHQVFDNYRGQSYATLLAKFGSSYSAITNGQTATENFYSDHAHADYTATLTAIKSASDAIPHLIQIKLVVVHRRGKFGDATYEFHTAVSQAT